MNTYFLLSLSFSIRATSNFHVIRFFRLLIRTLYTQCKNVKVEETFVDEELKKSTKTHTFRTQHKIYSTVSRFSFFWLVSLFIFSVLISNYQEKIYIAFYSLPMPWLRLWLKIIFFAAAERGKNYDF